jgi:hypothetical protein
MVRKTRKFKTEYLITAEFLHKNKNENQAATNVSFQEAHLLAKQGKLFTNGKLIKSCLIAATEECVQRK